MRLDEILHSAGKHKRANRVGRGTGSGQGKTAGRGTKGYYSRSGAVHRLGYEGGQTPIFARMPKRGFSNVQFARSFQLVNVGELEALPEAFPEGSRVDAAALAKAGLINRAEAHVKVLGDGRLRRKLTVAANSFSGTAIKKIMGVGGTAVDLAGKTVLPPVRVVKVAPPKVVKPKKEEKAEKAEKPEKGAKAPKAEKPKKAEKADKGEQGEKGDKAKKPQKPQKSGEAPK